jgi:DNA-binding transcriptional LysR family regulator
MMLDLESVRLFVLAADLGNLTRAAEAAGTVQPIVSQRLKALETALGYRLLERSPRYVRLTPRGSLFLDRARPLLSAHDAALNPEDRPAVRIGLGMSDHLRDVACCHPGRRWSCADGAACLGRSPRQRSRLGPAAAT